MASLLPPLPRTHPLQSDEDASPSALMSVRANAALAWGFLQGRLSHLPPDTTHLFCCSLVRLALSDALERSGLPGAADWLPSWFAGLRPPPGVTTHLSVPPAAVADAVLTELSRARWEPLALASEEIRKAARYERGSWAEESANAPASLFVAAEKVAAAAAELAMASSTGGDWPLHALDHLHSAAANSLDIAPQERKRSWIEGPLGPKSIETHPSPPPLWALDYVAGFGAAQMSPGMRPLPLFGTVRAEALRPYLMPRERGILVAEGFIQAVARLNAMIDQACTALMIWSRHAPALRSTSRAPVLYRLLCGFGPMCPVQIASVLDVSKGGVREIIGALTDAKLARATTSVGRKVIVPIDYSSAYHPPRPMKPDQQPETKGRTAEAMAAVDSAMADIDQLLERLSPLAGKP